MTHDELVWGARMAWRNAARCPARVIWKNLTVFDKRHIDTADEMFQAICDHLEYSNNGGNIRPAITVFRQRIAGQPDPRVWNSLMCQYAGYEMEDGSIMGDPAASGITKVCKLKLWHLRFPLYFLLYVLMHSLCKSLDGREMEHNLISYQWSSLENEANQDIIRFLIIFA